MSEADQLYDQIGIDYSSRRQADQRWADVLRHQLQDVGSLVNLGAGAGSYEPEDLEVIAVEPSHTMIAQRSENSAPAVCAFAEALPFADASFDAAMAILTVHHWQNLAAGLSELARVSRRQLILTWDRRVFAEEFWLIRDYVPEVADWERGLATLDEVVNFFGDCHVLPMPVPGNFCDGVLGAYWQRPAFYLDPAHRGAMSGLALLDEGEVEAAMRRLRRDLDSGAWLARNSELMRQEEFDLGYRLVVAGVQ